MIRRSFSNVKHQESSGRAGGLAIGIVSVTLGASPEASEVTIKSRFYRGDTGNTPAENLNDEAAVKAMNAYFKNGLDGLKKTIEK